MLAMMQLECEAVLITSESKRVNIWLLSVINHPRLGTYMYPTSASVWCHDGQQILNKSLISPVEKKRRWGDGAAGSTPAIWKMSRFLFYSQNKSRSNMLAIKGKVSQRDLVSILYLASFTRHRCEVLSAVWLRVHTRDGQSWKDLESQIAFAYNRATKREKEKCEDAYHER